MPGLAPFAIFMCQAQQTQWNWCTTMIQRVSQIQKPFYRLQHSTLHPTWLALDLLQVSSACNTIFVTLVNKQRQTAWYLFTMRRAWFASLYCTAIAIISARTWCAVVESHACSATNSSNPIGALWKKKWVPDSSHDVGITMCCHQHHPSSEFTIHHVSSCHPPRNPHFAFCFGVLDALFCVPQTNCYSVKHGDEWWWWW